MQVDKFKTSLVYQKKVPSPQDKLSSQRASSKSTSLVLERERKQSSLVVDKKSGPKRALKCRTVKLYRKIYLL